MQYWVESIAEKLLKLNVVSQASQISSYKADSDYSNIFPLSRLKTK